MRLRNPGGVDDAITTIKKCIAACNNLNSHINAPATNYDWSRPKRFYAEWVDQTYGQLGGLFADNGLADGLFSTRYWQLINLQGPMPVIMDVVRREMQQQTARLESAIKRLSDFKKFAAREGRIVVPDTSAFAQGEYFTDFDWVGGFGLAPAARIVVPILVVEQLDDLKDRDRGKARDRARRVLKEMRALLSAVPPGEAAKVRPNVTIEVLVDDDWHQRRQSTDGEIIEQALSIRDMVAQEVLLVCVDAAMEFRAREHGLRVAAMPEPSEVRAAGT